MLRRRPVVISNEIRLKRSMHEGAFLVVEGRDDRLFCERFVDDRDCNLVVAEGKESVLEVVRILDDVGFQGAVGLVDPDFDFLDGTAYTSGNMVCVDAHDLEATLIRSPALDGILVELGSRDKIDALGCDVRERLLLAAEPIGYLRWLSLREELHLRFHGLNLSACLDFTTLEPDPRAIIRELKNRSQRPDLDEAELERSIEVLKDESHDPWHVCAGEDLIQVLSVGLRRTLGTNSVNEVRTEVLKRALRLAFDEADFVASELHTSIRDWESRNAAFRVLR